MKWCHSRAGKKEVYFFFPSSEKRGEADVLERKNVQELKKSAVSDAPHLGQAGWCEIRVRLPSDYNERIHTCAA